MRKSVQKSIRLTDKAYNYIMSYPIGSNFNEKLENFIIYAAEFEDERKGIIANYDALIDSQCRRYYEFREKLFGLEPMVQTALHINTRIRELNKQFDEYVISVANDASD